MLNYHDQKSSGVMEKKLCSLLTSALCRGKRWAPLSGRLRPRKESPIPVE